jgi:hypothetical protein
MVINTALISPYKIPVTGSKLGSKLDVKEPDFRVTT